MSESTLQLNAPSEQAAVKVFADALGIRLSGNDLNPGGLFRAVSRLCGNIWHRCFYVAFSSVRAVCSLSGLRSITAVNALIASVILGPERALRLVGASVAVVAAVGCARACVTAPSDGVYSEEFIKKLSKDDQSTWGTLLQLIDTFDKVTENMPVLNVPKLVQIREQNPPEMFLRLLALVYQHQGRVHHTPPPHDQHITTQPRSAVAVAKGDQYLVASLKAIAEGHKGQKAAEKADSICSSNFEAPKVDGSAHQRQGTPAPSLLIHELREWMEYAEATYYHMGTEEHIEEWLGARGWHLLHASFDNRPNLPVHFIAVNSTLKKLLVSVRGTESMSDALTDMIMMPVVWGKRDERVHRGIGASAEALFNRLRHIAPPMAASGYTVVLVGHSLGAGVAALLGWLLRERCGISQLRAIAYATPACASRSICEASKDYVISCVMRDDAIPRASPRALVALQEEALAMTWGEMAQCAHAWGALGRSLYNSARAARKIAGTPVDAASHTLGDTEDESDTEPPLVPPTPPSAPTSTSTGDNAPPVATDDTTPAAAENCFDSAKPDSTTARTAKSHPITSFTDSQLLPSPLQSTSNPPFSGDGNKAVQVLSPTLADVNAPSPLVASDIECIDSMDEKLMVPFVPGTVVFLHPMHSHGVQHNGDNSECTKSSNSAPEPEQTTANDSNDDTKESKEAETLEEKENIKEQAEVDGGPQYYNRYVIAPDALTLGTIRIHPQGLNDHFLDQYRSGLGMRALSDSESSE